MKLHVFGGGSASSMRIACDESLNWQKLVVSNLDQSLQENNQARRSPPPKDGAV